MCTFFKILDGIQDGRQIHIVLKLHLLLQTYFGDCWVIQYFFWSGIQWKYFWKHIMRLSIHHGDIAVTKHFGFTHQ